MSQHIYYCPKCKLYTMKTSCSVCSNKTMGRKPAKFSPEDRWGKYRRLAKKD